MTHELKILPEYFNDVATGKKNFEIRKDDRDPKYAVGDWLILKEYDGKKYTGKTVLVVIKYIYRGEFCKDGYCVLGISLLWR